MPIPLLHRWLEIQKFPPKNRLPYIFLLPCLFPALFQLWWDTLYNPSSNFGGTPCTILLLHRWLKIRVRIPSIPKKTIPSIYLPIPFALPFSVFWTLEEHPVQVNNYEIVAKIFHVSHSLSWYSAIFHKFTRVYPVCSTYELTKQFL